MSVEIKSNISLCISLIALIATLFLAKIQFDTFSETKAKFVVNAENFELIPINENELSGMHLLVGEVRFENKSNQPLEITEILLNYPVFSVRYDEKYDRNQIPPKLMSQKNIESINFSTGGSKKIDSILMSVYNKEYSASKKRVVLTLPIKLDPYGSENGYLIFSGILFPYTEQKKKTQSIFKIFDAIEDKNYYATFNFLFKSTRCEVEETYKEISRLLHHNFLIPHMKQTFFEEQQSNGKFGILLKEGISIESLEKYFRGYISLDVLRAFVDEQSISKLGACA